MRLLYSRLHKYGNREMKKIFRIFKNIPYFLIFYPAARKPALHTPCMFCIFRIKKAPGRSFISCGTKCGKDAAVRGA